MSYTTVIVAFCVQSTDREAAMDQVMGLLPRESRDPEIWEQAGLDCWWIADDDRTDGSDNDSAVFVPMGHQQVWTDRIQREEYSRDVNPHIHVYTWRKDGSAEMCRECGTVKP